MSQTARQILDKAMDEEALLVAVTEALTVYGWHWTHTRRSDKAEIMGHPGVPDVIAAKSGTLLMLELKSESGRLTPEQLGWAQAIGIRHRVVRPSDLDVLLRDLADLG